VATQKFTPQMTRTLEYLNTVTQAGHYHLVQMIQFNGQDLTAYAWRGAWSADLLSACGPGWVQA
jgi:hypothetical protein